MENIIHINNKLVTNAVIVKIKNRNRRKLLLEDGTEILLHKSKKVMCNIQCSECGKSDTLFFNKKFLIKKYICKSCNGKGYRNGFYGKHHTEELKRKLSLERKGKRTGKDNPNYGKSLKDFLTPEKILKWKENLSKAQSGKNNGFYGKRHTEESKEKQSKAKIGKNVGEKNPMYGKRLRDCMTENEYNKWLSHFSETLEKQKTNPEKLVEQWLISHGFSFKYSFFLYNEETHHSHQYDFRIFDTDYLIEVQGDFWHGNPQFYALNEDSSHKKLNKTQLEKIKTDEIKAKLAARNNLKVLYIWEYDINHNNFNSLGELLTITK